MKILILHDIRSVHNVASIFRTADAGGVEKVYLTGYSPAPVDRFGRKRQAFHKVSLGAEDTVEWEKHDDITELINKLQESKIEVVAIEQSEQSIDLYDFTPPLEVAYILGNEVEGLEKEILNICDQILEIPMQGKKQSLNVSVAAGITLYHKL